MANAVDGTLWLSWGGKGDIDVVLSMSFPDPSSPGWHASSLRTGTVKSHLSFSILVCAFPSSNCSEMVLKVTTSSSGFRWLETSVIEWLTGRSSGEQLSKHLKTCLKELPLRLTEMQFLPN